LYSSAAVRIDEIIATKDEPTFSFEFFPPKTDEGERNLRTALQALQPMEPDFASVTYGAGGSTRDRTLEIVTTLKRDYGIETMAHLTCVGTSVAELRTTLDRIRAAGIDNVLALRGDPPRGETEWRPHPEGLSYSSQLAQLISENYPFAVGAACFPECHPQAPDLAHDIDFLKVKVSSGASFLITNVFFDNEAYFQFVEQARAAGVTVPILPGIMPITNVAQIKTITGLCGATIPDRLLEELEVRAEDPESVAELGVSYATLQCAELLARGATGIHFYTLNRSPATRAILSALRLLKPWASRLAEPVGATNAA
jgi:methylenetetrahydrofolate reductase (NADPH)